MDAITYLIALVKAAATELPVLMRFMVGLTLFLVIPGISERFKIPGMVGLIMVGMFVGPNGIDIWPDNPVVMTVFSEMGVLLVLFYAGLEIDLAVFKRVGGRAISFGLATLLLPLSAGIGLGYLMGYGLNAAILIGSLIASHTLLGFPILQKLGLASREPVLVTISGTIFTDIISLLILAVCVNIHRSGFDQAALALEVIEVVAYAAIVLFVVSRIADHMVRKYSTSHEMQMLMLLIIIGVSSLLAQVIDLEPIVGAFLAGVAASRSLRGTEGRAHIEVIGNTLFIPAFFFMIGMRINAGETLRMLWDNPLLSAGLVVALFAAKFLAAWSVGWLSGYSVLDRLNMWSLTLPQVAATLAATIVAHRTLNSAGEPLIDKTVVSGIFVLVMLTATLGPILTGRFSKAICQKESSLAAGPPPTVENPVGTRD
ncbi:MAG TPA: cation:proton antiporter [Nitrospiraceae bacterium]|nr:cation:proton antiporter [Nitrospiraceae bacterium]